MKEYQTVCAHNGERFHEMHPTKWRSLEKATQRAIDLNHHAEMHPNDMYSGEAPYTVQGREVGEWETVTPIGVADGA